MKDFKTLNVWKESHELTLDIYLVTKSYPVDEKFGVISQIRRSSASVPTNIAEGCGRRTNNELINFIGIAQGSIQEVEYLLILSKDLKYLSQKDYLELNDKANKIKAMLINFLKGLKTLPV